MATYRTDIPSSVSQEHLVENGKNDKSKKRHKTMIVLAVVLIMAILVITISALMWYIVSMRDTTGKLAICLHVLKQLTYQILGLDN